MEFLVEIDVNLPPDFDAGKAEDLRKAEARRGVELYEAGTIRRVWRVPGRRAAVAIWEAPDATALHAALASLPLFPWLDIKVRPLARHYVEDLIAQKAAQGGKPAA
ncbi:MAG: muconolactone Delta-isomerase [Parvibaculaceae bacterium]